MSNTRQLQRQRDARRVVQEGGDSERAGQGARHGNAGRGAKGDRESARGRTKGTGQSAHGDERGQGHGHGTRASNSGAGQAHGAGQSAGSGRRDTGHSAGHGQGHRKDAGTSGSARGQTQGHGQGTEASSSGGGQAHGPGQGTSSGRRGKGHDKGHGRGTRMTRAPAEKARVRVTEVGIRNTGRRAGAREHTRTRGWRQGGGPRPRTGKGDVGPRGQVGRGTARGRECQGAGQGKGDGAPPQHGVQAVRCMPPGIQQMPTHHAHHHHQPIYNIDPHMKDLIPPQPRRPPHQPPLHPHGDTPRGPAPAAREPRAKLARMAAAPAARGSGAAPVQQQQEARAEPAQGAEGARTDWARDWNAIPDPLGGETPPLVMEVYGWLSWAHSGTSRGLRNRPFNAVLLQRDGRSRWVPRGGWVAQEDHERVIRAIIWVGWPDRGPTWLPFLEGGAVPRVMDAEAKNWLPQALRTALTHWRYHPRNAPPPQPQRPRKRRRR